MTAAVSVQSEARLSGSSEELTTVLLLPNIQRLPGRLDYFAFTCYDQVCPNQSSGVTEPCFAATVSCDEEKVLFQCRDGGQTPPAVLVRRIFLSSLLRIQTSFLFHFTLFTVEETLCGLIGSRHKGPLECVRLGQKEFNMFVSLLRGEPRAAALHREMNHQCSCDGTLNPT